MSTDTYHPNHQVFFHLARTDGDCQGAIAYLQTGKLRKEKYSPLCILGPTQ